MKIKYTLPLDNKAMANHCMTFFLATPLTLGTLTSRASSQPEAFEVWKSKSSELLVKMGYDFANNPAKPTAHCWR